MFGAIFLQVVPASEIPDGWMGLDIGPDSIKTFNEEKFAAGTEVSHIN